MDLKTLGRLRTPEGISALREAAGLAGADPLSAAGKLRSHGYDPALAAAALTQAVLRARAAAKFGPDAELLFFTRAGLEQATRAVVARRRARRLEAHLRGAPAAGTNVVRGSAVGADGPLVADLGCGVGADTLAFAAAGLRVFAVDSDPVTARVAAANAEALGLAGRIDVRWADAASVDLSDVDAVFCDPARRSATGTGRRVFDPRAFSPPWSFLLDLVRRVPATVLKLAPGLDHALIPAGAEAEWVSVNGDLVEATVWCGPLATVDRRATVLRRDRDGTGDGIDGGAELTGTGAASAPVAERRAFLVDPDGAVVRAHLVAELAAEIGGTLADPQIAYLYTDKPVTTPFGRCLEVVEELPFGLKRLRAALRDRGIGVLEIKKRGVGLDPDQLRRDLRLTGPRSATLVLTRVAGAPTALLCRDAVT